MIAKTLINKGLWAALLPLLLAGCGTTMSGRVVKPDGSAITEPTVHVYTTPVTEKVRVEKDGVFKLKKNVSQDTLYTLIAEDKEGNLGYVRGFKPKKGENKNIVVRLSREVDGKDAVMEGGPTEGANSGPGEKILKSSQ